MKNILITLAFFLSFGYVVYAGPSATPSGSNINAPITQLPVSQAKDGSLGVNSFLVGNRISPTTFSVFRDDGKLAIKKSNLDLSNLPTTLPSLSEFLEVNGGTIRLSEINAAGINVCADSSGALMRCKTTVFKHSGSKYSSFEIYSYKVPTDVQYITVELYGAGAAGWDMNGQYGGNSPDNQNCQPGGPSSAYNCDHGGSAYLYDSNNSSNVLLQAKGGLTPTAAHTGGVGGTNNSVASSSKIISSSTANGGDGADGTNGTSADNSQTFTCGSTTYTARIGGTGGVGGIGGKSGPTGYGAPTPGGLGGAPGANLMDLGASIRCNSIHTANDGKGYLSEGGFNGQFGAGGSGAGGIGGASDRGGDMVDTNSLCSGTGTCPASEKGYAGGGGGGYVKAQIKVQGGETYKVKLSHGGVPAGITEDKGDVWCYSMSKWTCHGGSYSGSGSGAYARITVN